MLSRRAQVDIGLVRWGLEQTRLMQIWAQTDGAHAEGGRARTTKAEGWS